jgi:hypothetical protein
MFFLKAKNEIILYDRVTRYGPFSSTLAWMNFLRKLQAMPELKKIFKKAGINTKISKKEKDILSSDSDFLNHLTKAMYFKKRTLKHKDILPLLLGLNSYIDADIAEALREG